MEKLLKVEVPPRAQYLRAISGELCRIASHLVSVGTMATDIGATTPLVRALRERETVNDLIEALCGARLTYNYHRIGGVAFDLPQGWRDRVLKFLDHFDSMLVEWDRLITYNEIYVKRLASVAVITREQAIDYGLVGPNLRGSGVDWDIRRDVPYGAYPDFKYEVPVGRGIKGTVGDCFDRYHVRVLELSQSSRIVRQALDKIPDGEFMAKVPRKLKPEAGEVLSRVESARGEMAYYVVSDGGERAYRVHARTGSFMALALIAFVFVNFGAIFSGVISWYERRVAGRMQSRIGPNRAGFLGFFVWIADAVKLLLKEDLVPEDADALLFRMAPYFVLLGFALTFVVLPFGHSLVVADMNVGIFYVTSVTALVVVGILISGWSSNSKWALFGGMRSAAQVISYEIPAGIAIFVPVLMAGTLSMQGIIRAQGGLPWDWFAFRNPAAFIAFFILFTSQLAEGNRTPFDLPEAESELVAGYLSEYSGFRFALFFLAEWGNIWVLSAIVTTLFLGGWQIPGVSAEAIDATRGAGVLPAAAWWGWQAVSMLV